MSRGPNSGMAPSAASIARSSLDGPESPSAGFAHGAGDVDDELDPCRLALRVPKVEQVRQHGGFGHAEERLWLVRIDTVLRS